MLAAAKALAGLLALLLLAPAPAMASSRDYCDAKGKNVVVYVDVTTPYDDIDKHALVEGIGQIFESLKGGDRLSVRTIEDAFPKSERLVDSCLPNCPSQGILGDLFSDCTEGVVINDTKALRRNIAEAIGHRLNSATELPHSDIIRTIAMKAPEEFLEGRDNALFVFSDMIENSDYLPGAKFFATANTTLVEQLSKDRLVPALMGAEVTVVGIGRGGSQARAVLDQQRLNKLTDFWKLYFAAAGAAATLK